MGELRRGILIAVGRTQSQAEGHMPHLIKVLSCPQVYWQFYEVGVVFSNNLVNRTNEIIVDMLHLADAAILKECLWQ